jgi:glutathione S-transferase
MLHARHNPEPCTVKLYDTQTAPNPRRVRIYLAEKGVAPPETVQVNLGAMEQFGADFLAVNPWARTPVLVLDDGTAIGESIAICRYFEALHPAPPLFGAGAKEQAVVEMWTRRLDFGFYTQVSQAFRHLHPAMAAREIPQVAAWGEVNKLKAVDEMRKIDRHLADGRPFVCGDSLTIADISGGVTVDFCARTRIDLPEDAPHLAAWHARLAARPSWSA